MKFTIPDAGATISKDGAYAEVESVKAVSDVIAPLSGEVIAVNDLAPTATIAHLLRHDSTFGTWRRKVEVSGDYLGVNDQRIYVTQQAHPERIPWGMLGVDVVVEATGRFRTRDDAGAHLRVGARKVLTTAPGTAHDATIVMGLNQDVYQPGKHHLISAASCTRLA